MHIGAGATFLTEWDASCKTFGIWFGALHSLGQTLGPFQRALTRVGFSLVSNVSLANTLPYSPGLLLSISAHLHDPCTSPPLSRAFSVSLLHLLTSRTSTVPQSQRLLGIISSPLPPLHGLCSPPSSLQPSASWLSPNAQALPSAPRTHWDPPHSLRSRAEVQSSPCRSRSTLRAGNSTLPTPGFASRPSLPPFCPQRGSPARAPRAATSEAKLSRPPMTPEPEVAGASRPPSSPGPGLPSRSHDRARDSEPLPDERPP